jgi:thioredoxin 1
MPVKLTDDNYESYINKKNIIMDFTASWCGPCKKLKPHFNQAESFMSNMELDLTFATVDVDEAETVAAEYNIEAMPTIILIKNGKEVSRTKGFINAEGLLMMIGNHFVIKKKLTDNKCIR